jgi:PAS domain S-box-containing protein
MKVISTKFKILAGFCIAIIGIGYFLFATYKDNRLSTEDSRIVKNHLQMMVNLEIIFDGIQDIETSYRGYLLTGDSAYLTPMISSQRQLRTNIKMLHQNPALNNDRVNLENLEKLITLKTDYAIKLIGLKNAGKEKEAKDLMRTGVGRQYMSDIRTIISHYEKYGRNELRLANITKQYLARETRNNFLLLSIVILLVLSAFYLIISSDLRKSENAKLILEEANLKINDLYNNSPSGYISIDSELTIIEINKTALNWLGSSYDEIVNKKKFDELVCPGYQDVIEKISKHLPLVNQLIELKGETTGIQVLLDAIVRYTEDGTFDEMRIVLTDVRERIKSEEKINYLAGLIEKTSDAIISSDENFIIRSWNKGAEQMYGYTSEEATGQPVTNLFVFAKDQRQEVMHELNTSGHWKGEVLHKRKDGVLIPVYGTINAIRNPENENIGYVSVNEDISARKLYEEKLKQFNEELIEQVEKKTQEVTQIFGRISDGFIALDTDRNITYVNDVALELFKIERKNILGKHIAKLISFQSAGELHQSLNRAMSSQEPVLAEQYYEPSNKWYRISIHPSPEGLTIFFKDETEYKEAENRLIESDKKYKLLFYNNPLPMWIASKITMCIIDVNLAAIKHYGFSYEEFLGQNVLNLRPENERKEYLKFIQSDEKVTSKAHTSHLVKKDGTLVTVETLSYDIDYDSEPARLVIANDITEKIRYEENLRASRDQLRLLSDHLEKIREEERTNIAREIHDELGQQLTGLKMDISWLMKRMKNDDETVKGKMSEMIQLVDDTVKTVRKISSELRPGILDDLGLSAALDWQSNEFRKRTGIQCFFSSTFGELELNRNIATGIFRIYQETLTNIARHSGATEVTTFLNHVDGKIELSVTDNGKGMEENKSSLKTLGIIGMRERALMMKGDIKISGMPGHGTCVQLVVPLTENVLI